MSGDTKRPREEGEQVLAAFTELVRPDLYAEKWLPAGSIRRKKPMIGDIEIVYTGKMIEEVVSTDLFGNPQTQNHNALIRQIDKLLEEGTIEIQVKQDGHTRWGNRYRALRFKDWTIEMFQPALEAWGVIATIRTGSGDFIHRVIMSNLMRQRKYRVGLGYMRPWHNKLPEANGLTDAQIAKLPIIPVPDEETMFRLAGIPYLEPEQREYFT